MSVQDPSFWYDWQRLAAHLWSGRRGREIAVLRRRAQRHIQTLDRAALVTLGTHLGLLYPHLLPSGLLQAALNPFYPWFRADGVPLAVSDIALHRLVCSPAASKAQVRNEVQHVTVLLQNSLGERDRPDAFHLLRALRSPVLLLTAHAWQDPLLDAVSHLSAALLSPAGALPPFLLTSMTRDLGGPMIRLRCPACRRVLTPGGLCRVHGQQSHYTAWP